MKYTVKRNIAVCVALCSVAAYFWFMYVTFSALRFPGVEPAGQASEVKMGTIRLQEKIQGFFLRSQTVARAFTYIDSVAQKTGAHIHVDSVSAPQVSRGSAMSLFSNMDVRVVLTGEDGDVDRALVMLDALPFISHVVDVELSLSDVGELRVTKATIRFFMLQ